MLFQEDSTTTARNCVSHFCHVEEVMGGATGEDEATTEGESGQRPIIQKSPLLGVFLERYCSQGTGQGNLESHVVAAVSSLGTASNDQNQHEPSRPLGIHGALAKVEECISELKPQLTFDPLGVHLRCYRVLRRVEIKLDVEKLERPEPKVNEQEAYVTKLGQMMLAATLRSEHQTGKQASAVLDIAKESFDDVRQQELAFEGAGGVLAAMSGLNLSGRNHWRLDQMR